MDLLEVIDVSITGLQGEIGYKMIDTIQGHVVRIG
jgi:hypothetical protein